MHSAAVRSPMQTPSASFFLPLLLLLSFAGFASSSASSSSTCPNGKASYASLLGSTARYAWDTARLGGSIGTQSGVCTLPHTPTEGTFSIWGYIYAHQFGLLLTNSMSAEERFHVSEANARSVEWLRAFAEEGKANNTKALEAIEEMRCHVTKARSSACDEEAAPFRCCAFAQYETWLRVATILSRLIVYKYGDACGTPLRNDTSVTAEYESEMRALLASLAEMPGGAEGRARLSSVTTAAWALRGVCDARNDDCALDVASDPAINAVYQQLVTQSLQSDLSFGVALLC